MKPITVSKARELFFSSDAKYVSQEQTSIYYDNFSGELDVFAYLSCDCLVVKTNSDWHIHALSAESDVCLAIQNVRERMNMDSERLFVLTLDRVPEELAGKNGAYKFARVYMPYHDRSVRRLTGDDSEQIKACCSPDAEDNTIGKNLANEFLCYYNEFLNDPNIINLGLFENGDLVGFAQAFSQNGLGLSTINIFVNRAHRKRGYAKRLLAAICATSDDVVYCYSCVKSNTASIHTAKSCGFEFKGAYLLV